METSGRRLGRYQLLRLLGFGGMGEVYLAISVGAAGFEKLVTVKMLRRTVAEQPERVRDLLREAFIGVRLDHENIVQVLDLVELEGDYFVVIEYVRGFSLRDVIAYFATEHEQLPIAPIVHVARCVADALDYVHRVRGPRRKHLGLIHRDVSPSNILLGAEGRIKLSDFGVAVVAQEAIQPGAVIGKPKYLPPEAARLEPATQGWDLYALGVVLHAALSCTVDVHESGPHVIGPPLESLAELRPDCPRELIAVVERATARDPAARFADAAAFRRALDGASPRQADDGERWKAFVQATYARDSFVARYGVLPHVEDLVPDLSGDAVNQSPVAYVETVVVDNTKPLRFGMSPALGVAGARVQGERVATWLRGRLQRDVRASVLADYQALADALVEGEIDFAWMPPIPFVWAADRGAGILAISERDGRPAYESAIVVRDDSTLAKVSELEGKSMGFVDRNSASGYLFAADLISRELGMSLLGEQHFHGSHRAVCEAVLRGWVDAGTTYVVRDRTGRVLHAGWLDIGPLGQRLRPLAYTDAIPCDNLAHRPGLASATIERLTNTVVEPDGEGRAILSEVFHTSGMLRADMRLYDSVRDMLARRKA